MIGLSMTLSTRFEQKPKLILELAFEATTKDYDGFWNEKPKHSWTIPTEIIDKKFKKIESRIQQYNEEKSIFLAEFLGGCTVFVKNKKIPGIIASLEENIPIKITEEGLKYDVALTSGYDLVNNVRNYTTKILIEELIETRRQIPKEKLKGTAGIILAPATPNPHNNIVYRKICPFLFTDYEIKDKKIREDFRKVSSATLVSRILGGEEIGTYFKEKVAEFLGVKESYQQWFNSLSKKTYRRNRGISNKQIEAYLSIVSDI